MKKNLLFLVAVIVMASCNNVKDKQPEQTAKAPEEKEITTEDVKNKSFDELFTTVKADETSLFLGKHVGSEIAVLTAGKEADYNSMVISWGGWGTLLNKPSTWCFLGANRYTLEFIKKEQTYTLTYFKDQYKDQVMFLGSKTGKGTDKMKENTLTAVKTPSGNMVYKEAQMIVECKLTLLTTVSPKEFYTQEGKDFVADGFKEAKDYHKLVFGEVTCIWVRK